MCETSSSNDGYAALEKLLSKRNPHCDTLFQYPKRNWEAVYEVWYEIRPLGKNKLATTMKEIADLSRTYTNHSIRSTAITLWSDAGLIDREIMAISSHRSESKEPANLPISPITISTAAQKMQRRMISGPKR